LHIQFHGLCDNDRFAIMGSWIEAVRGGKLQRQLVQIRAERAKKHDVARLARLIHKSGEHNLAVHLFLTIACGHTSQVEREKLWGCHVRADGINLYAGRLRIRLRRCGGTSLLTAGKADAQPNEERDNP
jgi:hypothetical protein